MADKPFRCKLITPQGRVFDASVSYASVPMWDGKRGVMKGAAALVGRLGPGEFRVEFVDRYEAGVKVQESGRRSWFVAGGFVQNVNDELTVLASSAVDVDQLDEEEARRELADANARSSANPFEMERITRDRQTALAKLGLIHMRR